MFISRCMFSPQSLFSVLSFYYIQSSIQSYLYATSHHNRSQLPPDCFLFQSCGTLSKKLNHHHGLVLVLKMEKHWNLNISKYGFRQIAGNCRSQSDTKYQHQFSDCRPNVLHLSQPNPLRNVYMIIPLSTRVFNDSALHSHLHRTMARLSLYYRVML